MTIFLADANVLVALVVIDHVHHTPAQLWFENDQPRLATCPITQGALLRFLIREGKDAAAAMAVLEALCEQEWHEFWPDDLRFDINHLQGVIGHRQVTDAYLVALARHHGGRLVTIDRGLSALHGPDVLLIEA